MNSIELACLGECLCGLRFLGVFPRDMIPQASHYPSCLIANTDTNGEPGSHWVAIVYVSPQETEFFDSFALPPYMYNIRLLCTRSSVKQIQCNFSTTCGHHCLYFLYLRSLGFSIYQIVNSFDTEYHRNDSLVRDFVSYHRSKCPVHFTCQCPHVQTCRSCHSLFP
jgi:hypothetical protein